MPDGEISALQIVGNVLHLSQQRRVMHGVEQDIRDRVVSFWSTRAPLIAPEAGTKRSNDLSRCDRSFTSEEITMSREDFCQYIKTHNLKMDENLLGLKYLRQARRRFKMRSYKVVSRAGKAIRPVRNPALLPKRTDPLDSQSVFSSPTLSPSPTPSPTISPLPTLFSTSL
jgi:hypothetical protein